MGGSLLTFVVGKALLLGEGIRKKFFTARAVGRRSRLPSEAVDAPSMEALKARLGGAVSNPGWWEVSLPTAGGWNEMG